MGRTHGKDTTFARAADNMGFVPAEDILEHCKVKCTPYLLRYDLNLYHFKGYAAWAFTATVNGARSKIYGN